MRLYLSWLLVAALLTPLAAEKTENPETTAPPVLPPPVQVGPTQLPWIGCHLSKLDQATRAHARNVPYGVGFIVTALDDNGPARKAGLELYDILWRLDDQLLVNEAQLGTLLRLHKVGDTVNFLAVRSGKVLEIPITLAAAPPGLLATPVSPSEIPLMPTGVPGMPRTIVYPRSKTAEMSRADGSVAKLRYVGKEPHISIRDAKGDTIYDGPLMTEGGWAVPEEWKKATGALLRTLKLSEDPRWRPGGPRPRVIVPQQR